MSNAPSTRCYCGIKSPYSSCCEPYHKGESAPSAEALMRARFSAYMVKNYHYILKTYAPLFREELSVEELAQHSQYTDWLALDVIEHSTAINTAHVEFKAYYRTDQGLYVMHEQSDFIYEHNEWFYTEGKMLNDTGELTLKRNDPCVCNSGKKFKKCCGFQ
jgi:SEC-C motif-containing protein